MNRGYHYDEQAERNLLGPWTDSECGRRWHFVVAPSYSPQVRSTATVDSTSAAKGLASYILTSSDLSLSARVAITWSEFVDRKACRELHDESESKREREREVKGDRGWLGKGGRDRTKGYYLEGGGVAVSSLERETSCTVRSKKKVRKMKRNVGAPTC